MKKRYLKAISFVEYAFTVVVVIAAIMGMQIYFKRALSARWRQTADIFGHGRVAESNPGILWE